MEEIDSTQRLGKAIASYFKSEKKAALLLIGWALICLIIAWYLYFQVGEPMETGVTYPLGSIAVVQLVAGVYVLWNSSRLFQKSKQSLQQNNKTELRGEYNRMEKVKASFEKYKMVEMLLFFLGFAFLIGGGLGKMGDFTLGTGVGLTAQSAFSLVIDLVASYRAGFYLYELNKFINT